MKTQSLLTLALAGLLLPLSAEAQVSRLDSRYGVKKKQQTTKKSTKKSTKSSTKKSSGKSSSKSTSQSSKKSSSKTSKSTSQTSTSTRKPSVPMAKPAAKTVTPDLPANLKTVAEDALPQEDAAISMLRKLLLYINSGNTEATEALFEDQIKFAYAQPELGDKMEDPEAIQEDAAARDFVMNTLGETGVFTGEYEVVQIAYRRQDNITAIVAMIMLPDEARFANITMVVDTDAGKIKSLAITSPKAHPQIKEIPAEKIKLGSDSLIELGVKEFSGYSPIKSATTAEGGGWWAPDMEFTTDPVVRKAILGPSVPYMNLISLSMLKDNYLFFFRESKYMRDSMQARSFFAPRVHLIGLNREVSREELTSMITADELLLEDGAHIIDSGYMGHCLQFVISYKEKSTREKKYIRVCMVVDDRNQVIAIMESKCVNASPKVNSSFTSLGRTTEVIEDVNEPSREDWINNFMSAWSSGDATAWDKLLNAEVGHLYLPGMTQHATKVPKAEVIELMQQSMPSFLKGGYEIVKMEDDGNSMTTATIVFNEPAPNGRKVKAEVEVNHIKVVHGFWVNMSYVDNGEKFKQVDFVSAVEGISPDDIPVEERLIKDLPQDIIGYEFLRRMLEAAKAEDTEKMQELIPDGFISKYRMPHKTGIFAGSVATADTLVKDLRILISDIGNAGYSIYVSESSKGRVKGLLTINEGKAMGYACYTFDLEYSNKPGLVKLYIGASRYTKETKERAGDAKVRVAPAVSHENEEVKSLCPADMDFFSNSMVKAAEASNLSPFEVPKGFENSPKMIQSFKDGYEKTNLDDAKQMALVYHQFRIGAKSRKVEADFGIELNEAKMHFDSPVNIIGESNALSLDELCTRLDSTELAWGSNFTLYKVGYKGKAVHAIYRINVEGENPLYLSVVMLRSGVLKLNAVGESLLQTKEPVLAPGYKEADIN